VIEVMRLTSVANRLFHLQFLEEIESLVKQNHTIRRPCKLMIDNSLKGVPRT